ncbi:hypothetical protein [Hymenobacter persicinus]|nr:hypothetical protein [Hymenobacter persicinus]
MLGSLSVAKAQSATSPAEKPMLLAAPGTAAPLHPNYALGNTGWAFVRLPAPALLDEKSGAVRFAIVVTEAGKITSATPTASTVSAAQEKECQQALLTSSLNRIEAQAAPGTYFYNFRFTIK